jgi:hypothetical protein
MTKRKKIEIHGVPVSVVSDEEAEEVDFVVCALEGPTEFTDNFKGICCACSRPIMYRWHAPRKPKKVCIECAAKGAAIFATKGNRQDHGGDPG